MKKYKHIQIQPIDTDKSQRKPKTIDYYTLKEKTTDKQSHLVTQYQELHKTYILQGSSGFMFDLFQVFLSRT